MIQIYPIRIESYPDQARKEFELKVVPKLRDWLLRQLEKPETAVLGHEEVIVAWNGFAHTYVSVRFL